MKRAHAHQEAAAGNGGRGRVGGSGSSSSSACLPQPVDGKVKAEEGAKAKAMQEAPDDELLAALGYKVRSSSMADVAQKLEQLEMAMAVGGVGGVGVGLDEDGGSVLAQLASETVHYNPSDLNSWLENMLSELNVPPPPHPIEDKCVGTATDTRNLDFSDSIEVNSDDLTAIIPAAARESKRIKSSASTKTSASAPTAATAPQPPKKMPVVLVEESQEAGIRLVHALLACAEAVQQEKLPLAESLVNQIALLTASQGGAMRKVSTYFAEALGRRIYQIYPTPSPRPRPEPPSSSAALSDLLEVHFYEACPYLKFAHFTANQAILEAFSGKSRVHVIDLGMKQGMQWPALMQALALRPGGPPLFRLTGIGPPQPNNSDQLQEVGWKLAQFAESVHVEFEYRGFLSNSLADLEPYMFDVSDKDTVAVNSVLELHRALANPGAIAKVLATVKSLKPTIVTVAEQEANHNGAVFLDRFTEALHYYCSMFDSLEGGNNTAVAATTEGDDLAMAEVYLGRQICDVVACEGAERLERHETAEQWKRRFGGAGFQMVPLGSNAYKQASILLQLFAGGGGYRVEEKDGCLMLGWHTRPLITTSAWRVPSTLAAGGGGRSKISAVRSN